MSKIFRHKREQLVLIATPFKNYRRSADFHGTPRKSISFNRVNILYNSVIKLNRPALPNRRRKSKALYIIGETRRQMCVWGCLERLTGKTKYGNRKTKQETKKQHCHT